MTPEVDPAPAEYSSLLRLDGRGYIVLGAGAGMGRETVRALRQLGARVLCVDRDAARAEAVALEFGGIPCTGEITDRTEVEHIVRQARTTLTRLDGIVDIVGMARTAPLTEFEDTDLAWQQDIVLRHAILAVQAGARELGAGGAIVLVGSMSGIVAVENQAIYGAMKAALHHFARAAALELGPNGVRVNVVAPGFTKVPRLLRALGPEQWKEVESTIPLRRANSPSDIAGVIAFLLSDLSRQMTGQVVVVDGGQTLAAPMPRLRM